MDNIYKNNAYSRGEDMWHNKGRVGQNDETAEQVYSQMEPVVFEQHPFTLNVNGVTIPNNVYGIVRIEGTTVKLIGTTKDRYVMRQPIEYIRKFDEVVGKPCETLGFLGANADKLFLTWVLPKIDIHGDIVKMYGMLSLGFDGKYGNHLYDTAVRVICWNTHAMAIADATQTENQGFGIGGINGAIVTTKHTQKNHLDVLGYWMKFVHDESERQVAVTKSLFTKMEEKPMTVDEAFGYFSKVYPYPNDARTYIPPELVSVENQKYAEAVQDAKENRDLVMSLFSGAGISITPSLYGAYNCVTEHQNHRIMAKKNDGTESILIGARGKVMDRALKIASEML